MIACRYCRAHLGAYLTGELAAPARRRVSAHLDTCAACYAVYAQRRDLARELGRALPLVGQAAAPDFAQVWLKVQAEIPRESSHPVQYGLVALLLTLLLLAPFTMGHRDVAPVLPTQPAPHLAAADETPARAVSSGDATAAPRASALELPAAGTPPTLPEPHSSDDSRGFDDRSD